MRSWHSFKSICIQTGAITAMLRFVQQTTFFLHTKWGESNQYIGGDWLKVQNGMCQGNGAATATWLVLIALIVDRGGTHKYFTR